MIRQQETPESESNSTAQQALENANKVDDGREALSKVNNTVQEASDSGVLRFVGNLLTGANQVKNSYEVAKGLRTGNGAQVFQGTAGGIVTALNAAYRPSAIVTVVEVNVLTVALTAYKDSSNVNNLSQQNAFANQMLNRLDELESQQRQIDDQIIALPGCY